jgi:hypothetical protein
MTAEKGAHFSKLRLKTASETLAPLLFFRISTSAPFLEVGRSLAKVSGPSQRKCPALTNLGFVCSGVL